MTIVIRQPFHKSNARFVDEDGLLTSHAHAFLNSLWVKTGSGSLATADAVVMTQQSLGAGTPVSLLDALTQVVIGEALIAANQGSTHTVLHGDANGHLFFAEVDLSQEVINNLDVTHLDSGNNANISHFWAGDGHWRIPSQNMPVRVVTAAGAVLATGLDWAVIINKLVAAPTTVQLPGGSQGQWLRIKDGKGDASTNNITVSPTGPDKIDGGLGFVMSNDYESCDLVFGTEWSRF